MRVNQQLAKFLPILCAMAVAALADSPQALREPGLVARFYELGEAVPALPQLAGSQKPSAARIIATVDFKGDFAPFRENFYTEISGYLRPSAAGEYLIELTSDDGARLYIDNRLVIDHDGLHGPEPRTASVTLRANDQSLRLIHFQGAGGAALTLRWKRQGDPDGALETVPQSALWHDAKPDLAAERGAKRFIRPIRRGLPGDGAPLTTPHPLTALALDPGARRPLRQALPRGEVAFIPPGSDEKVMQAQLWVPSDQLAQDGVLAPVSAAPYAGQMLVWPTMLGEMWRAQSETVDGRQQGWVTRFGAPSGTRPAQQSPGQRPFEIDTLRLRSNGLEISFSEPLDSAVGWDPESVQIEQWPIDAAAGPQRDGVTYAARTISVADDRRSVFIEQPELRSGHVVYVRLLPPWISASGRKLWATEAWYTVHALPRESPGVIKPRPPAPVQNVLTEAEQAAGWRLLFDGQTLSGWRSFGGAPAGPGWQVIDGCIVRAGPAGDLVTDDEFENFELTLDWRISPAGNSGIFFHVGEGDGLTAVWQTGPEMQILDNSEHADGKSPLTSAGSNYALHAPARDVTRPVGLFNTARLVVRAGQVEHWLNGERVVQYQLGGDEWKHLVSKSKFSSMPRYGTLKRGRIAVQDHGDRVWFRNIKIREL